MKAREVRTPQEVRAEFLRKGKSVASWARVHGVSAATTSQVLSGKNRATRGEGHKIAVLLGLKEGEILKDDETVYQGEERRSGIERRTGEDRRGAGS